MTGTLQNYARKHVIAIDKLNCNFKFIDTMTPDQVTTKPDDGCYIYGLFLEGAKYHSFTNYLDGTTRSTL